jgi:magnesium transporter
LHLAGTLGDEFWNYLRDFLDLNDEQVKQLRGPHKQSFFEDYHNGMFWTLLRPSVTDNVDAIETVNFFLADKVLVTRQFSHDQAFSVASHRLMEKGEHFSNVCVDSLAAVLIEDVLNSYVDLLKLGGTKLEEIQNKIILRPGKAELHMINRAQQVIWIFLNQAWPVETVLQAMQRSTNPLWTDTGKRQIAYRQDETAAVIRLFETYRAMSYNLMDVYVSGLSLRTNETTTILTVIATLILPPSLIAAIYGMNFFIPEVHATFGYYVCLAGMVLVSGSLLYWLRHKGYIEL